MTVDINQAELRRVMAALGKKGGSVKSERKAEAARRNGAKNQPKKKGGRPKSNNRKNGKGR